MVGCGWGLSLFWLVGCLGFLPFLAALSWGGGWAEWPRGRWRMPWGCSVLLRIVTNWHRLLVAFEVPLTRMAAPPG